MRIAACIAGSCALLLTVAASAGPPTSGHRDRVRNLLLAARGFPTKAMLLRTGPEPATNRVLTEMALSRHERIPLRLNAVRAMEYFDTPRSEEVLMSMLYSKGQKASFKKACLRALARGFGVRMYFEILPFMRDDDSNVREGAAIAMGEIDDTRVRGILNNHLVHEKELLVRMAIEKAIGMIDERARRPRR